ncbi:MAG: DNA helicase PcrA, partial [Halanaerobiales bacterium]
SGKTRVLTRRVAYLIENYGVDPRNILAVTFTNKAANEMKERVASLLGGIERSILVSTFHSFCVRILRREIGKAGYDRNFVIYDTSDQRSLIRNVLEELNIDKKKFKPRAVLAEISNAKNELIDPEEYAASAVTFFTKIVSRVYNLYQEKLKANNALDFDDLIMKTVELFREYEQVLDYYQERFKYILIDEYQDVNTAQYQLVQLLAGKYRNICVVGDPDQGIYGFRGADIRNILNFEDDYPEARVIKLEQNYRSYEKILEAADSIISQNDSRKEKKLWTDLGEGNDLNFYIAYNEKDEANYVCRNINELTREKYSYRDIAVLYRTNAQSRPFEDALVKYAVPYQIIGGVRFYDRKEIKDVIAYLRVIYNPEDEISLLRIINSPRRGIGKKTIGKLQQYAAGRGIGIYRAGLQAGEISNLGKAYQKRVKGFIDMMESFREDSENLPVNELTERVLDETGYVQELKEDGSVQAQSRLENIQELFSVMEDFQDVEGRSGLAAFLEEVSLIADVDNMDEDGNHITLMTFHSAKGLEFPVVFMVGMEEGIFPHANSLMEEDGIEEERRLCYVGITRAREELFLTMANERMRFGEQQENPPSQFLRQIPGRVFVDYEEIDGEGDYLQEKLSKFNGFTEDWDEFRDIEDDINQITDEKTESGRSKLFSRDRKEESEKNRDQYQVGQKIYHPKWGVGKIIEKDSTKGLQLTIKFSTGKPKKLLAEYAPIQKV